MKYTNAHLFHPTTELTSPKLAQRRLIVLKAITELHEHEKLGYGAIELGVVNQLLSASVPPKFRKFFERIEVERGPALYRIESVISALRSLAGDTTTYPRRW